MAGKAEVETTTVDADGHIMEPPDLWEKYLEPEYKDRAIRFKKDEDGLEYLEIAGKKSEAMQGGTLGTLGAIGDPEVVQHFLTATEETTFANASPPGGYDGRRAPQGDGQGRDRRGIHVSRPWG